VAEDGSEACDSVRLDDPHVANVVRHELGQHAGDGRLVHLEGEEICRWPRSGHRHQRIAATWSDFDNQRRRAAERGVQVDRNAGLDRRGGLGAWQAQHELVVVPLPGSPLLWTHAGAPADE
jgi:hypothetical protein